MKKNFIFNFLNTIVWITIIGCRETVPPSDWLRVTVDKQDMKSRQLGRLMRGNFNISAPSPILHSTTIIHSKKDR